MTIKQIQLAGRLLELAADAYANHQCNDMDPNVWGNFTDDERKALVREYYEATDQPEEAWEDRDDIEDYILMRFLGEKLQAFQ